MVDKVKGFSQVDGRGRDSKVVVSVRGYLVDELHKVVNSGAPLDVAKLPGVDLLPDTLPDFFGHDPFQDFTWDRCFGDRPELV